MQSRLLVLFCAAWFSFWHPPALWAADAGGRPYLSPAALAVAPEGKNVFVGCATAPEVIAVDLATRAISRRFSITAPANGLAVSRDGKLLVVTCGGVSSRLEVLNTQTGQAQISIPLGHTGVAPVLSHDETTAFVCYRFQDAVGVIDLRLGKETKKIGVRREPVAAALSHDGKHLLVANHLPAGAADRDVVAATISVIDCATGQVIKELTLPSGSTALNDIAISPDGKHAVVSHILARFQIPAAQLERGWMNTNAKTIIDLTRMDILNTVLLDSVDSGAANPWGLAWTRDGKQLILAHAGSHELSVVDFPGVLQKLSQRQQQLRTEQDAAEHKVPLPVNDLAFLTDLRRRVALPPTDRGPRAVAVAGTLALSANYFSDSLTVLDLSLNGSQPETIRLGQPVEMDEVRRGEFYFHDASICFQTWQSCATCHPGEARVDGLNWDLLNDGIGNPKNTRTLLLSHRTPPAMSMGVRETAETAVRAGIKNILMTVQRDAVARSIDAYLKSLQPVPSPKLIEGKLSPAAVRGERIYAKANCVTCHPKNGLFTDMQSYDVGTRNAQDRLSGEFDTPSLVEVWRTAPYLHDGSAPTLREVFTTHNRDDQHGNTSKLSEAELADLCEYVLSL
jgi:DNA-binding beta-propeller fold protein YncE/mono/diheme cytochrome c family protein